MVFAFKIWGQMMMKLLFGLIKPWSSKFELFKTDAPLFIYYIFWFVFFTNFLSFSFFFSQFNSTLGITCSSSISSSGFLILFVFFFLVQSDHSKIQFFSYLISKINFSTIYLKICSFGISHSPSTPLVHCNLQWVRSKVIKLVITVNWINTLRKDKKRLLLVAI